MTDEEMAVYGRRHDGTSNAMNDIWRERIRQMEAEGYDAAHDDKHAGDLAMAGSAYALFATFRDETREKFAHEPPDGLGWPWGRASWKPKDRRRDLIRAAALIVAEIERLDRAARTSDFGVKESADG